MRNRERTYWQRCSLKLEQLLVFYSHILNLTPMNRCFLIGVCLYLSSSLYGQVIPYGMALKPNGSLEFILYAPYPYRPTITDTIFVENQGEKTAADSLVFCYTHLRLLEPESPSWTNYGSQPDFSYFNKPTNESMVVVTGFDSSQVFWPTAKILPPVEKKVSKKLFKDVWDYHGHMNDSSKKAVVNQLEDYVHQYHGKDIVWQNWYRLHEQLSEEDTVIDKAPVYDFILDKMIVYQYRGDQLEGALGYFHGMAGVEKDSIRYDSKGNLIYFCRESVGITRDQLLFSYDTQNRLTEYKHLYYSYQSSQYGPCPSCPDVDQYAHQKFTYDEHGLLRTITSFEEGEEPRQYKVYFHN